MEHGAQVKIERGATQEQIDRAKATALHLLARQAKLPIEQLLELPIDEHYLDDPIQGGQYYRVYVRTR